MFAQVELPVSARGQVLAVPVSAVMTAARGRSCWCSLALGASSRAPSCWGERSDDHVVVREGLKEGELVVTAANFLIDAEEGNLKAALVRFGSASNPTPALVEPGHVAAKSIASVSHRAEGVVDSVDAKGNAVTLSLTVPSPA